MIRRPTVWLCLLLAVPAANASEDDAPTIERLLAAVGESGCAFIRNGKEHTAAAAEDHLRMKYRRGRRWVDDAETFIERIATKSSFSGRPYLIRCAGEETQRTADWLNARLAEFRDESERNR